MRIVRIDRDTWIALEETEAEAVKPGAAVRGRRLEGTPWHVRDPALATSTEAFTLPDPLLPPIDPPAVWCIGKNYAEHAREFGGDVPDRPVVFMKPPSCVIGGGDAIVLPKCQENGPEVDYEAELAVVVGVEPSGEPCKDVSAADALDYVFGYTCGNDVSARHWQKALGGSQWVRGKSFDTFAPIGPALVTARPAFTCDADVIDDPQALAIACELSGDVRQRDTTANMIFPVTELISFLSMDTTLVPGSVIFTGTPSGVGMASDPPRLLNDGDKVSIKIEQLGTLSNPVRDAPR